MSNIELILNFIGEHPWLTFFLAYCVFSWTPVKIIHNHNNKRGGMMNADWTSIQNSY